MMRTGSTSVGACSFFARRGGEKEKEGSRKGEATRGRGKEREREGKRANQGAETQGEKKGGADRTAAPRRKGMGKGNGGHLTAATQGQERER